MAKLAILTVALLVALMAVAEAASFRTTITTTVAEQDDNQGRQPQRQCGQQIQRQWQQLRACRSYLSPRGQYLMLAEDEEEIFDNQQQPGQHQQQSLRQCCDQLQNFDQQCQCEAIRALVQQQQQQQTGQGGGYGRHMEQVRQKARYLPRQCRLRVQECRIQSFFA